MAVVPYYYLNTRMVITVWLVIFASTTFCKTSQNLGFTNFAGVIFAVSESWTSVLAAVWLKAERMSRIIYIERWQSQFFISVW